MSTDALRDENERLKDKIRGLEKLNQMTDEEVVMELKAEIEGLKREVAFMASNDYVHSLRAEIEGLKTLNQEERETLDDLAKLCTRAADALEYSPAESHVYLIAELREAAG